MGEKKELRWIDRQQSNLHLQLIKQINSKWQCKKKKKKFIVFKNFSSLTAQPKHKIQKPLARLLYIFAKELNKIKLLLNYQQISYLKIKMLKNYLQKGKNNVSLKCSCWTTCQYHLTTTKLCWLVSYFHSELIKDGTLLIIPT